MKTESIRQGDIEMLRLRAMHCRKQAVYRSIESYQSYAAAQRESLPNCFAEVLFIKTTESAQLTSLRFNRERGG